MPETSVSRSAIFSARPTLRIAGQPDARASTLLTAMTMEESEGGLSTLELRLTDWVATGGGRAELAFDANSALKLGAALAVYAGDEAAPREIFQGRVSALEMVCDYGKPPELVVLAVVVPPACWGMMLVWGRTTSKLTSSTFVRMRGLSDEYGS